MNLKNPPIYFLDGTCATGKTTLIEYYLLHFASQLQIISDVARNIFATQLIFKKKHHTFQAQKLIQDTYLQKIKSAIRSKKPVLVDGSPFTSVAYAMLEDKKDASRLLEQVKSWGKQKTLFFLLNPKDINYQYDLNDPIRTESEDERLHVHQNLLEIYRTTNSRYEFVSGNIEERVSKINKIILAT